MTADDSRAPGRVTEMQQPEERLSEGKQSSPRSDGTESSRQLSS